MGKIWQTASGRSGRCERRGADHYREGRYWRIWNPSTAWKRGSIFAGVFGDRRRHLRHCQFHAVNVRGMPLSGGVKVWRLEIVADPAATRADEQALSKDTGCWL